MLTETFLAIDPFSIEELRERFIAFQISMHNATVFLAEVDVSFQMYTILPQLLD